MADRSRRSWLTNGALTGFRVGCSCLQGSITPFGVSSKVTLIRWYQQRMAFAQEDFSGCRAIILQRNPVILKGE